MSIKKDSKTSRAALKRFRDLFVGNDDNPAQDDTDLDAHEELFFGALSQLRTIRVPGKADLTLEESFNAALHQYEAFQKWCDSGKPLGEIRGCVEGKEVFRVNEDFDFYGIAFGVPPPADNAVLQITTDVGGEEVVLYNVRLQDVSSDGITHTEFWPNGQSISLTLTREMGAAASQGSTSRSSEAKFRVKIAVNAEPFEQDASVEDSVRYEIEDDETSGTDNNKYRTKFSFFNWEPWLTPFSNPVANLASVLALAVVPTCVIFFCWPKPAEETPAEQVAIATIQSQSEVTGIARQQNESHSPDAGKEITKEPASTNSAPLSTSKTPVLRNHVKRELAKDPNVSVKWHSAPLLPMPRFTEEAKTIGSYDKNVDQGKKSRAHDIARYNFFTKFRSPEMDRFAMLAALSRVSVRLEDTAIKEATEPGSLRSMFSLAFDESSRFRVLNDTDQSTPDVVIVLRYEPNEANVGVVFVELRDANGRFIWQDYADCQKSAGTDQDAMFSVAAETLVSQLEKAITVSKQTQVVRRRG